MQMLSINLSESLFWDLDITKLDEQKNKRIIVERVFSLGDITDVKAIIKLYGIDTIKQEIIKAGFLDKKTLKWVSDFLNIPIIKFKCHLKKQLNQAHWNY